MAIQFAFKARPTSKLDQAAKALAQAHVEYLQRQGSCSLSSMLHAEPLAGEEFSPDVQVDVCCCSSWPPPLVLPWGETGFTLHLTVLAVLTIAENRNLNSLLQVKQAVSLASCTPSAPALHPCNGHLLDRGLSLCLLLGCPTPQEKWTQHTSMEQRGMISSPDLLAMLSIVRSTVWLAFNLTHHHPPLLLFCFLLSHVALSNLSKSTLEWGSVQSTPSWIHHC